MNFSLCFVSKQGKDQGLLMFSRSLSRLTPSKCFVFQFLLLVGVAVVGVEAEARLDARKTASEDESIQAFVLRRAQGLGYGLRIIPRVKELLFGRSSKSKPSHSNSITNFREKRKLIDFRRPSRVTSHTKRNKKKPPRNVSLINLIILMPVLTTVLFQGKE